MPRKPFILRFLPKLESSIKFIRHDQVRATVILKFKVTFKRKNNDCAFSFIWEFDYVQMHKMGETPLLLDVYEKVDTLLRGENGSLYDKILSIEDLNESMKNS